MRVNQRHCTAIVLVVALLGFTGRSACAETKADGRHVIEIDERVLAPEEGMLLGNGDLSASVYQARDGIIWRFGKPDVWDRRLDLSDDPKPADIDEIAHGIQVEGWKCGPYGGPVEATRGTKSPKRMRELCQGTPPSYIHRPYPCPKPVGELALRLPPDMAGMKIRQRLSIEEARLAITCSWPSGVQVEIDSFIHPVWNVLVVHWKVAHWNEQTRMGQKPPVWFSLYRWPDPTIQAFAARFFAESRHGAFRECESSKATPLAPPVVKQDDGAWFIEQAFPPDPLFKDGFRYLMAPLAPQAAIEPVEMAATGEACLHALPRRRDRGLDGGGRGHQQRPGRTGRVLAPASRGGERGTRPRLSRSERRQRSWTCPKLSRSERRQRSWTCSKLSRSERRQRRGTGGNVRPME